MSGVTVTGSVYVLVAFCSLSVFSSCVCVVSAGVLGWMAIDAVRLVDRFLHQPTSTFL